MTMTRIGHRPVSDEGVEPRRRAPGEHALHVLLDRIRDDRRGDEPWPQAPDHAGVVAEREIDVPPAAATGACREVQQSARHDGRDEGERDEDDPDEREPHAVVAAR